jgi:hypothetical protein
MLTGAGTAAARALGLVSVDSRRERTSLIPRERPDNLALGRGLKPRSGLAFDSRGFGSVPGLYQFCE